jgi:hypothetical protein
LVMKKEKMDQESLPSFLEELRKDNPFKTPHTYFRELPDEIMGRVGEVKRSGTETGRLKDWWEKWIIGARLQPAWVIAIVIVISGVFLLQIPQPDSIPVGGDLTSGEIAEYVQLHIDDFEESDFYQADAIEMDILGETFENGVIDPILEDIMDDLDLETLQRVL